jgi:hypothetical protein
MLQLNVGWTCQSAADLPVGSAVFTYADHSHDRPQKDRQIVSTEESKGERVTFRCQLIFTPSGR